MSVRSLLKVAVALLLGGLIGSDALAASPTLAQRNEPQADRPAWGDQTLSPDSIDEQGIASWNVSPVDLSFLNAAERPAGKRGFLGVVADKLVFADGTVARFWGTNLTASSLFQTPRESVRLQARRLSELGFNLVRIHHHDSFWVRPNIFGDGASPDTRHLSAAALEALDWWIKCLKDEGIYIWLDLHVQRELKKGDGIEAFDEIAKGKPGVGITGYNYVNSSIQLAMQQFNEAYLGHKNTFTGLRYKDDPAIVALLLTNENDVTRFFGNKLLPSQNVPRHTARYMAAAESFAARFALPRQRVWRSWEHGPSKLFLNDLERRFNVQMIQHLRKLGARMPIATTSSWGENPLSSLPALTAGDLIDVHSYGRAGELEGNPLRAPGLVHWIAAAQIVDRPLTVTEWNVAPFPVPDRHLIPLYIASFASLQGWDALMQYAYAVLPLAGRGTPSNWAAFNDPSLLATLPAAALLYRRHDVQEARTVYAFAPTADQLFDRPISPANSVALRTAAEKGKLVIAMPRTRELPWLEKSAIPVGAELITDPDRSLIDANANDIISDTGEARRNWTEGTYTIDTPRSQVAMGRIGGLSLSLADVGLRIATSIATVAVQSLDANPISTAGAILISLGANSVPKTEGQLPFRLEPVSGELSIRARAGLKLFRSQPAGKEDVELPAVYDDGRYQINLDLGAATSWLVLK
jgi:hypothetical protein